MESSQQGRGVVRKRILFFIALGWFLLILGDRVDELRLYQGATLAMYTIGLASIVLLTGYSGQVSLGNGALMAVGAYSAALSLNNLKFPVWATFIVAIVAASLFGMILGFAAARLSGPYLAGTTLALAVGLPAVANQFAIFGGEQGISFNIGMPPARLGAEFLLYKWFFWIASFLALIALFIAANIVDSRFGRTWRAIRGNALAAELSGVNVGRSKVLAFSVSAGLAGLAGAVLAMTTSLVSPGSFALSLSFALVTGAVLAGISSLPGVMLGAVILVAIPEIADVVAHRLGDSERVTTHLPGLIVSVLLILSVIFTPNGPGENLRKHRKKHA
ncbi:MAG: branched-chain amino acid ABC transporter permease [Actinobacteria bacterium]|nr:branched-chain amino acid ABC transporter permease [Actinomycetota bacterium]